MVREKAERVNMDYDITPEMVGTCVNIIMDYCKATDNKCESCALRVTCQHSFKIPPFAWKRKEHENNK